MALRFAELAFRYGCVAPGRPPREESKGVAIPSAVHVAEASLCLSWVDGVDVSGGLQPLVACRKGKRCGVALWGQGLGLGLG